MFLFLLMMPIGQAMNAYAQLQAGLGHCNGSDILAVPTETAADPPAAVTEPADAAGFDRVSSLPPEASLHG